jgi:phytoene dehydrogenase-like protein
MSATLVIGGGVNGLVCATLLARAGRTVTLLEQRDAVGGAAVTRELTTGFRVPAAAHDVGPLRADVARDLNLNTHGLEFVPREAWMTALDGQGHAVTLWHDVAKTRASLAAFSQADADRWPAFMDARTKLGRVVASILPHTPPSIDTPAPRELWRLLQTARQFRALGAADGYRLLRWGPMPVADLVAEHVETPSVAAALAADGVFGAMLGPWSAGSGLLFLLHAANQCAGDPRLVWPRGGPGALTAARGQRNRPASRSAPARVWPRY